MSRTPPLKERGIRIFDDDATPFGRERLVTLQYRFTCRGYQDTFGMMKVWVNAEMSVKLGCYVAELGDEMRDRAELLKRQNPNH